MAANPTVHAAVICDQAIQEAGTGKWTLVGLFTDIGVPVVESNVANLDEELAEGKTIPHPNFGIYFCLGDAYGKYEFKIQLVRLAGTEEIVLASADGRLEAKDKLKSTEIAANFRGVGFPGFGKYVLRLVLNGQPIADKGFRVSRLLVPGGGS